MSCVISNRYLRNSLKLAQRRSEDEDEDDDEDEYMDSDEPVVAPHIAALDHLRQDFRLNYDQETPQTPFDRGGPDQLMRYANNVISLV